MRSFSDKLRQLRGSGLVPRERLSWRVEPDEPFCSVQRSSDALPGSVESTPDGPLRVVRTEHDEDHRHGTVEVATALEASAPDLAILALDPSLATVDFRRALYVDTETTGLRSGAGTLPFLIGCAWFEDRRLIVEQLLLERPGEEVPMLRRLAARLAEASAIVSYNGKSFDWPLLRTRFIMNRVPAPLVPSHLDLLHCARRVYKERLGQVKLIHIEEQVLGFTRNDDLSGALIPETYLGYVRGHAPASALTPIVDHNRRDLVALSALLGEIARRFRVEHDQDVRDQLAFAQVAARAADHERAARLAEQAAERDVRGELAPRAHYLAGKLALERGDVQSAVGAFERSIEAALLVRATAADAHLALAKIFEHKLRNYTRALDHAAHARELEGELATLRRTARLEQKCLREAARAQTLGGG